MDSACTEGRKSKNIEAIAGSHMAVTSTVIQPWWLKND